MIIELAIILWLYVWSVLMAYEGLQDETLDGEVTPKVIFSFLWPIAFPAAWIADCFGFFDDY